MRMLQKVAAAEAKAVDTVLLADKSFGTKVWPYNLAHYGGNAKTMLVESWAECLKELGPFSAIKRLVLLLHSAPGVFLFHLDSNGVA